jgi:hypothetical protein
MATRRQTLVPAIWIVPMIKELDLTGRVKNATLDDTPRQVLDSQACIGRNAPRSASSGCGDQREATFQAVSISDVYVTECKVRAHAKTGDGDATRTAVPVMKVLPIGSELAFRGDPSCKQD